VRTNHGIRATILSIVALGTLTFGTGVAAAHGDGTKVLRLTATELQSEYVDVGDEGTSLGDQLVFSEALFRDRREVGMSGIVCTVVNAVPPYDVVTFHCVGTLSLRRGQITLQGLIEAQGEDDPGPFTAAITGGTGKYRGAGGEATIVDVSATRTVYRLKFTSSGKHHHGHRKGHH
jgi:hypothetical protein